ncbi:helix-turn-helix transcriptional regulator [Lactococcus lactis]|uniref:helix-turn-helix domain-containing protein n=1 Tax=Lactococcus lactis TaxID=1358 RepID=UPI000BF59A42|nr:helix-turn-helix transcriptional regulator [Lactococcus lactis]MCH5355058.1 helix-turn-helix domain-containing protein [Lactococcus lactis]PFG92634.1 transcriptional regulator [Lactococcus lactis subsp. lactis]
MKNITFAERLKEARKAANLSQQALADKIGRTKSTISRWESGERNPKMFEMVELENILGIQARDLMFGEQEITDTILPKISQVSSELTKPRQEKVLNFATDQLDEQKLEQNKVKQIEDYRLSDEYLEEQISKASAYGGGQLNDNDKEFFKRLLKNTLKEKIDKGDL